MIKSVIYRVLIPFVNMLPNSLAFRLIGYRIFKAKNKIIYDDINHVYKLERMPSPEELSIYYEHSYWSHFNIPTLLDKRDILHYNFFVENILNMYWQGDRHKGKFVNYGGAFGGICFLTAVSGRETLNVDFTASQADANPFITLSPNDFWGDTDFEEAIDFFYASHSIEHVQDISTFKENLKRVLKPGGIFFGEVPNAGTENPEFMKLTGGSNGEIITPHTYYFTKEFFYNLLGFEVLELIEYPSYNKEISEIKNKGLDGDSLFFVLRKKH